MTSEHRNVLFAGVPRRSRIGGAVTISAWLLLCGAFVTDAIPTRPADQWLYDMEATRDGYARARASSETPARRAARTPARDDRSAMAFRAVAVPTALAASPDGEARACACP